ncbi:YceI family protein [Nonomuraea sp. NBC_01738]|uniref:YceI family protein n=1 Tax=Nonomuraea sp. NBC_01738 TaxID=2976003 RepID=UPI002E142585|nr:YceI family protein [Nonomuraea sp. NBC_01738]
MSTRTWDGIDVPAAGVYKLDVMHTNIGFVAKHMMVSKVRGHFTEFDGSVTIAENPLDSAAEITIKTASISTGQADRDGHLRSDDFLAVEKFPEITFRTNRVVSHSDEEFVVLGDLTIRDVSREVELKVEYNGSGTNPWGQTVWAYTINAEINREDFGLTWNQALETGGVLVGKKIKLEIEGEANPAA